MLPAKFRIIAAKVFNITPFSINYKGLRSDTVALKKNSDYSDSKVVVCLGDSNTFGWNYKYSFSYPVLLENKLKKTCEKVKVINCGIGGDTAIDGFKRIESDVLFFKPVIVILNFGFNDGKLSKADKRNDVGKKSDSGYMIDGDCYSSFASMEEFKYHMENIVLKLQKNHIKIVLISLYEIKNIRSLAGSGEFKKMIDLQNMVYSHYNDIIKNLALKNNIEFLDLWNKLYNCEKIKNYLQIDGFHLNKEGYEMAAEDLRRIISRINCNE